MRIKPFLILWMMIVLLVPTVALGATARQTVENKVNQLLKILKSDTSDQQKREAIRKQVSGFFDFELMSKLALSRNWKRMDAHEREQFVPLYRKLLEETYMNKLLGYDNQKVRFGKVTELAQGRMLVRTQIISEGQPTPLEYRMIRSNSEWYVYDVVIEDVSLARNYRSQFSSFLQDKSVDQLLETLRRKTQDHG